MLNCETLIVLRVNRVGHCGQRDGRLARDIYWGVLVRGYFSRIYKGNQGEQTMGNNNLASTSGYSNDNVSKIKQVLTKGL